MDNEVGPEEQSSNFRMGHHDWAREVLPSDAYLLYSVGSLAALAGGYLAKAAGRVFGLESPQQDAVRYERRSNPADPS